MTDNFDDGSYNPDTKETILDALVADAETETAFGSDLNPDELSIIRAHYSPVAERFAELQDDLKHVLQSAQIDNASGTALDLLAAWIGVTRNPATQSTGRARFSRNSRATQDYTIAAGTVAQTDESDPIQFDTDITRTLGILDDFEDDDLSNYEGDTGDFSTQTGTVQSGTYALKANAAADSKIWTDETTFGPGTKFYTRLNIGSSSEAAVLFSVEDTDNYYEARIDNNNGNIEIGKVESGSFSSIDSTSATIPDGEWLDIEIDWKIDNDIILDVDNQTGGDVAKITVNDDAFISDDGGFGFKTLDSNAAKYFDDVTMSAVGAPITSIDAGADQNVGSNALIVMPSAPNGVESVTNTIGTDGGTDKEEDNDFRQRAKTELGDGIRGTQDAMTKRLQAQDYVKHVDVIENDSSSTDGDGRPDHSFEPIIQVDSDNYDDIAQVILDTKGTGYPSVGGHGGTAQSGTAEKPNGENKTINFSTPTGVDIYFDVNLTKDSTYAGDDQVQDNIVQYVGGVINSGANVDGELGPGDDVIYNQVVSAIVETRGVVDVTTLEFDNTATPTGTSNYTISSTDIATSDATDGSIDVTSSDA